MNLSKWLVFLTLTSVVLAGACSKGDEDSARQAVKDVGDKTKEVAGEAAEKTKEAVAEVADKSKEVVSATGEKITDGWITTKVSAKLADEKLLKGSHVNVDTKERVVTLKGTVGTTDAKKRAVMVAGGTEGVLQVVDEVVVKP
jgi:osmotically-inducible protein OsmY